MGMFVLVFLLNVLGVLVDFWGLMERGNVMVGFGVMVWIGFVLGFVSECC